MDFFVASIPAIILQVLLIVHCIKTGRNQLWIWVLALLSYVGVLAYVAVELIPDLFRSRTTRSAVRGVSRALDPGRDLRAAEHRAKVADSVESQQLYADELARQGRRREAIEVYRRALTGLHEHDPKLMLGLASAQYEEGEARAARETLDALRENNPDFRSPDGHLLYARALVGEGDVRKALDEYRVLSGYFPGAEATVRYSQLLRAEGQRERADELLRALLDQARIAPAHYRRTQREWLTTAERDLGR